MIKIASCIASAVLIHFDLPDFASEFGKFSGFAIIFLPFLQLKYRIGSRKMNKLINQRANWHGQLHGQLCIPQ